MATLSPDDIKARAAEAAFGKPIVVNNLRALIEEMIIASALEPSWTWRASDWAGWDEGAEWIASEERVRHAHLYVFAYHGVEDDKADHRDPLQWSFYVVPAGRLPPAKSIALSGMRLLTQDVGYEALFSAVEGARLSTKPAPVPGRFDPEGRPAVATKHLG